MTNEDAKTHNPEKRYFGRDSAAAFLDMSTRGIDQAISAGKLRSYKVGRRVLINREDLIDFVECGGQGPIAE